MKLTAEISIDLDANRKIWITGSAEDVEPGDVSQVQQALQEQVTAQGLAAYSVAGPPKPMSAEQVMEAARASAAVPQGDPSERRPRPEDPESMRTFGEDED